jgi:four helix bundle protein
LKVWQRTHAMTLEVYRVTASFPREEMYGLTSQVRRAAVSVAANIAEGSKRAYPRDYARFLNIAEGSIAESECLLLLARDLGYLDPTACERLTTEAQEISRMLNGLRSSVEQQDATSR